MRRRRTPLEFLERVEFRLHAGDMDSGDRAALRVLDKAYRGLVRNAIGGIWHEDAMWIEEAA